jgi:hypothetical protein
MLLDMLVDNDILIKLSCYSLLLELPASTAGGTVGILGAARYVVGGRLRKSPGIRDRSGAQASFDLFLDTAGEIEPTEYELSLSADIEELALREGLPLDSGESQLCAVAIARNCPLLLTGDKRAIRAAEVLLTRIVELLPLRGRIACLEQVIMGIVDRVGPDVIRARICAEPGADRTLAICFGCSLPGNRGFANDGLLSYLSDLRSKAPSVLYPGRTL